MDASDALDRARRLVVEERRREAISMLRDRVTADPASIDNRRILAELYRDLGHPDQAGRWGLLVEGYTTEYERREFASLLRNSAPTEQRLRALLNLDRRATLPEAARLVLDTAKRPASFDDSWLGSTSSIFFVLGWIIAVGSLLVVFVMALSASSDVQAAALIGIVGTVGSFVVAGMFLLLELMRTKLRRNP